MNQIIKELEILKEKGQFRHIPSIQYKANNTMMLDGKEYINFASNDYLGISTDLALRDEFLSQNKSLLSSASARLLSGTSYEFNELENTLKKLYNKSGALIFNTGYQCNLGVISALISKNDVVFSDKLNHASIIDGMKLAEGNFIRYKHLDYEHLEKLLESKRGEYKRALIVSESIFSMDGDIADINKLIKLKKKYNCLLMIDEAHAFCAWGDALTGIVNPKEVDIITATFGKALGSFGAFCVANEEIIQYLVNKSRSFIFSTSIPPINIAWSNWLLTEKIQTIVDRKKKLRNIADFAHSLLNNTGTHIIPIVIGSNERTLMIAEQLKSKGFYIPAIRPPTVQEGTARLRLSLTAETSLEDIKTVLESLS